MKSTEYHKIQSPWHRHKDGTFDVATWSHPAFEALRDAQWEWQEKIDGTNVRIEFTGARVDFRGRTENAQLHTGLVDLLREKFTLEVMASAFGRNPVTEQTHPVVVLYGEGIGPKIQKIGPSYRPDSYDFVLFDVFLDGWWLESENVRGIAENLGVPSAPMVSAASPLTAAIDYVAQGFESKIAEVEGTPAEGLILRPREQLFDRRGHRIITKLKTSDFARRTKSHTP